MRKIIIPLLAALLIAGACEKTKPVNNKTSLEYLNEDYEAMTKRFPNLDRMFVEAQYELNGIVSQTDLASLRATKVINVFYYWNETENHSVVAYLEREFCDCGTPVIIYTEPDTPWLGDSTIPSFKGFISLEEALTIVKTKCNHIPDTRYVTLRHPVEQDSPRYVFGGTPDREWHIQVDARTGEIFEYHNN